MNNTKNIKGYTVTVALAKNVLGYKVGQKFSTNCLTVDGVKIVTGHGMTDTIPHDCLGEYEATWKEVVQDGDMTTTVTKRENVTTQWKNYWATVLQKRNEAEAKEERAKNKRRIAHLRQIIKMVKTGKAEAELNELLGKI